MTFLAVVIAAAFPVLDLATNSVAKRVEGVDPAACLSRFLDYPPSKGKLGFPRCLFENPFPPNPKFWLKGVDFSSVSPWNDSHGTLRAGTLISKRHIVFAAHFPLAKGTRILFADNDVGTCPCYVGESRRIDGTDIQIAVLNAEVTPNISPAKILPDDYAEHIGDGSGLPVVTFNQREQAYLSRLNCISSGGVSNDAATDEAWKPLGGRIVGGDSGNPAFLLIGNQPILLYCLFGGGVGHGPSVFHHRMAIQKAMDELCPGYKLEAFDFSKITNLRW